MAEKYLIGIDIGSSFSKASIFDTRGNALGTAKRDTHPRQPRAGVQRAGSAARTAGVTLFEALSRKEVESTQRGVTLCSRSWERLNNTANVLHVEAKITLTVFR